MDIRDFMKENTVVLDGAMGSLLMERGLKPGERGERWNLSHPEEITAVHRAYFDAGSNLVITNTFGATRLHFSAEELAAIVPAAVENARRAAAESAGSQAKFVGLDIGPSGQMMEPWGDLEFDDAVELFGETVRLGAAAGADLIFVETMNDLEEAKAALQAAKTFGGGLPVFVSDSYGANGRLLTGATPADVIPVLEAMGAEAVGLNCSLGPAAMTPIAEEYLRLASVPVIFKPNAGLPTLRHGRTVYDVTPEEFAPPVAAMARKGARLVGGCCGTSPDYIAALTAALKNTVN